MGYSYYSSFMFILIEMKLVLDLQISHQRMLHLSGSCKVKPLSYMVFKSLLTIGIDSINPTNNRELAIVYGVHIYR